MNTPVIQMHGVHAYYGSSHVLHGIDLTLNPGTSLGLLGRNGMGKTTTLKTIMGLVRPGSGKVEVFGRDTMGMSTFAVAGAGIAYVPEERGIFPNLTVFENLTIAARPSRDKAKNWTLPRVLKLFPRLAKRLDYWGNNLSGGEQQMLTIGRALMTNPSVLLLDEATEGLAPLIREEIWRVVHAIKGSGISTIIIDKSVKKLTEIADRHMILVKGRVVFEGNRGDLLSDPDRLHRYLGV